MKFIVLALLLMLKPEVTPRVPCFIIAPFVVTHGKNAVIAWAREKKYTEVQIAEVIKRCEIKR